MSDVLFKASLQNTLNPEVGTFNKVGNKEGTFTLENGEYYLTNNTDTSYRVYYPTKDITYSVGFTTIEFDVNYNHSYSSLIHPCLLFNGDDDKYWYAFGTADSSLYFQGGPSFPNYEIVASPSTWLHVKCIFDYNLDQSIAHIYINNVEVKNFTMGKNYDIKTIDILGNNDGLVHLVPDAKIKNIIIYHSKRHYLDTPGLTSLWSKIKSLFATKSDLNNYYTKEQIDTQSILKRWPDGPEAHNSMWGGRDITAAFDSGEFSEHVADGTFKDIFPGDYITKFNIKWVVADCDYWWHKGDQGGGMTAHHVVIVPQESPRTSDFIAQMNTTNTTEGGYAGSSMYKNVIPTIAASIVSTFGSDHILTFRDNLSNSVNTSSISSGVPFWTGASSNFGWYDAQCNLMSEAMVYGGPHCASSAYDTVMATRQMSAFRLSEKLIIYGGQWWWLRDVVSSEKFANADGWGCAFTNPAGYSGDVRPFALLC